MIISIFVIACESPQSQQMQSEPMSDQPKIEAVETESHVQPSTTSSGEKKEFSITASTWKFEPSVIRVKEGDAVTLRLRSIDVSHGIGIKEFGVSLKVGAGEEKNVTFIAEKKGTYTLFCNVFCGEGHRDMKGVLVVE